MSETSETEAPRHEPVMSTDRHVLGRLGLSFAFDDTGSQVRCDPHPLLLDGAGHISFGALGVLFDLASGSAFDMAATGPWVHADIAVHRVAPPCGTMSATAWLERSGKRTAIVSIDLVDSLGTLVAASTQEIAFLARPAEPVEPTPEMEAMREGWRAMFDGVCRLVQPLEVELGIERDQAAGAPTWTMALANDRTNGMGGLHGGCATTLVDVAAAGAVSVSRGGAPTRTLSASVRYLTPARVGPFHATPRILADDGTTAVLRVPIVDTGAGGATVITADVTVIAA